MENVAILLFYKFEVIENPEEFTTEHQKFCDELGVLGKVLVAKEGINGSISGTKEQAEKYKVFLRSLLGFNDIVFKEEFGVNHPFTRMIVRVKKEIVALNKDVDTKHGGAYLSPKEFMKMCEEEKDDIVLIDARNDYEYQVGRFKGAVNCGTRTFREFPEFVETLKDKKDKKIVMYCTGGIRCEKASAYMKQEGFDSVYQLDGGVITYCQELPNTLWEGKCFVFDKRLISEVGGGNQVISDCICCSEKSDLYRNCKNVDCDILDIICVPCQEKYHGCCSKECMTEFLSYSLKRAQDKKVLV